MTICRVPEYVVEYCQILLFICRCLTPILGIVFHSMRDVDWSNFIENTIFFDKIENSTGRQTPSSPALFSV